MVNKKNNNQVRLPLAGDILVEAWKIYKKKLVTFLEILFFPAMASILFPYILLLISLGFSGNDPLEFFGISFSAGLVFIALIIVLYTTAYVSLIYALKNKGKKKLKVLSLYKKSLSKIAPFWWVLFLVSVIVFAGLVFLIIPGIIFSLWFGFAVFVLIDQDKGGLEALLISKDYVSGRLRKIFWRFLFIAILVLAIILVVTLLTRLLGSVILGGVIHLIAFMLLYPLVITYCFILYEKAKKAREKEFIAFPKK